MQKQEWDSGIADNVWSSGQSFALYWKNKDTVSQHSVLMAGSKEYLLKLASLASEGFNPDFNVEGIESFADGELAGELVKRGWEKLDSKQEAVA